VFPVRYELNFYILFRRNSVFKWLIDCHVSYCFRLDAEKFELINVSTSSIAVC
jgi:hypothetical protein